ncbi:hypothetical protein SPRG_02181 [Saprolegnia parasitica CBS 223.65]|uniref:Receptor L-domain domain-containing protein n=1 Tax=Saprolegnia parasitica (strain CBS 223.65) TaxID=695850 RepID=A0A067CRP0_SAPPC|nr:hypothetical protein SPRG_02181 [Saprolegnia parasitica CBS 223.65]KDO33374.1 hypothetical protein SPRG_02181 [Saprolegnia parasitica CBS 223.65]|eukprot:XP_012196122.1 hypothetical protein SPRG_02181 [Saprolegnia parasitica CBS 223.65]
MWKRILLLWCPLGALAAVNESISWGTLLPSRPPRHVTQVTLTTDCRGVNFTSTSDDDTITFDGVAATNWTIEFPSCVWFPDGRVARGADVSAVDARGSLKFGYLYAIRNNLTVDYVEHLPSHASTIILDNLGINALHDDLSTDDRGRPVIANRVQMVNNAITTISGVRFPDTIDVL